MAHYYYDLEDLREAYVEVNRQYATMWMKKEYLRGIDRMFTKGYLSLKTYLVVRTRLDRNTKVSSLVKLIIERVKLMVKMK